MTEVCDPGLVAIEKRGEYYGLVFNDLGLDLQVAVVPDPLYSLPKALLALASLLLTSLSILVSDETVQPR